MTHTQSFQRRISTSRGVARSLKVTPQQGILGPVIVLMILMAGFALSGRSRDRHGSPVLTAGSAQLSFGSVTVGTTSTQTLQITNTGRESLTVSSIAVSRSTFKISGIRFPLDLGPGSSHTFKTTFAPTSALVDSGLLTISSNASDPTVTIPLSGTGTAAQSTGSPALALSASSLSFGSANVGTTTTQSLTLSNSGSAALVISNATVSGTGYTISALSLPLTLNPGQSTPLAVSFDPTAAGSSVGSVSISSNASVSPARVALSGTGVAVSTPVLALSSALLSFGSVNTGTTTTQSVTLSNSGTGALIISSASVSGTGYTISALAVPVTLNAGQITPLTVSFDPKTAGSSTGSISITSNSTGSASSVALSGTGVSLVLNATPSTVSFGSVATGTSNSQTITLSNAGVVSVSISQALVTGTGMSMTGMTMPFTIAAGKTASFNVVFDPTTSGAIAGSIALVSNATDSPLSLALSGTGTTSTQLLSVSPASLAFGNVTDGSTGQLSATLTNTGTSNVLISSVTASGTGFSMTSSTSSVTLTPGQSVTVTAQFAPVAAGSDTGSITVASNATNSPGSVALTGTGIAAAVKHSVSLSWTPSTSTVAGYNIYRTIPGGQYAIVNTSLITGNTFTDSTVTAGQTYNYVATAQNSAGVNSADSNMASANVPAQ